MKSIVIEDRGRRGSRGRSRCPIAMLLVILAGAVLAAAAAAPQDLERLLKAAMNTELVDGNLKAAIEQYKKVAESGNRALAAQALVHMAECYQKLGDAEARTIYERLIRDYADQREAAAIARARLERTEASTGATMASRRLWTVPPHGDLGDKGSAISLDGRFLRYFDKTTRSDLVVHDFVTGRDRRVTNSTSTADYVLGSAISRDGKQVAYTFVTGGVNRGELRVASLEGTGPLRSRLLFANPDVSWPTPFDWSPDGKWIAVQMTRGDGSDQLGLIAVGDGSLRVLKSSEWRGATQVFFSPDGKYIGIDLPVGDTANGPRDVFVLAVDGSREVAAVVGSSDDTMMGWSPDGKFLLFASDRRGAVGLWALPTADGRPQGAPELIIRREGNRVVGAVVTGSLTLSPDGRSIAAIAGDESTKARQPNSKIVLLAPVSGGEPRELLRVSDPAWLYCLAWTPDGRAVLVTRSGGGGANGRGGELVLVPTAGGQPRTIDVGISASVGCPAVHPDGRQIAFVAGGSRNSEVWLLENFMPAPTTKK